jgi:hypothetical protein
VISANLRENDEAARFVSLACLARRALKACQSKSAAPAGAVGGRGERRNGFRAWAGVALQRPQAGVPALGHQQGQAHVLLGQVGEGRVAQLVQRPPVRGLAEQRRGATAAPAQPGEWPWCGRRLGPALQVDGEVVDQPAAAPASPKKERTVARWRFQVAGARSAHAAVTAAVTWSAVRVASGWSAPSSRSRRPRVC